MALPVEFRSYTIDPVTPTSIIAPFACHTVKVEQTDTVNDALLTCTVAKRILAGAELVLAHPGRDPSLSGNQNFRGWTPNQVVGTVLSAAGTGPISVTFLGTW